MCTPPRWGLSNKANEEIDYFWLPHVMAYGHSISLYCPIFYVYGCEWGNN
jgi:hypothetical protein